MSDICQQLFTWRVSIILKSRNATNTKSKIINAARHVFEAKGYDMATLRDIAEAAGCNVALVARYFGSKQGLFGQAVLDTLNLKWSLSAAENGVAQTLVDFYTTPRDASEFDGFVTILRSFASPEVGPLIRDKLETQGLTPIVEAIDGADARARGILLTAQLTGLIFHYRVLAIEAKTPQETKDLRAYLLPYLQELLGETSDP
jgi:AcrR family transcriptional regulator